MNLNRLERKHFADEKVKEEVCRRAQAEVLGRHGTLAAEHPARTGPGNIRAGLFQRRLRTLYFGQEDKAAFVKNLGVALQLCSAVFCRGHGVGDSRNRH